MTGPAPWTTLTGGVRLAVRLTPHSKKEGLEGIGHDAEGRPHLLVRLAAPPVEGAANVALIGLVSKTLGLRKADVAILSGERSRLKTLRLSGDPAELGERLAAWLARKGGAG